MSGVFTVVFLLETLSTHTFCVLHFDVILQHTYFMWPITCHYVNTHSLGVPLRHYMLTYISLCAALRHYMYTHTFYILHYGVICQHIYFMSSIAALCIEMHILCAPLRRYMSTHIEYFNIFIGKPTCIQNCFFIHMKYIL